jgi:DNA-binding protein Alba
MVNETIIIIRHRNDRDKSIKDAIFAFSGGRKSLLIKGEGQEISTAVEVAEILKNRMYPRLEIANVSLGSRPYFNNRRRRYRNKNSRVNKKKIDIVSNIEITLQTKSIT